MRYAVAKHGATTAAKLLRASGEPKVIGIPIIGGNVDEMLPGFAKAVKMGANRADLYSGVAIRPGSAEGLVSIRIPQPHAACRR